MFDRRPPHCRHLRSVESGEESGANLLYPYRIAFGREHREAFVLGIFFKKMYFFGKNVMRFLFLEDKWKNSIVVLDEASGIFSTCFGGKGTGNGIKMENHGSHLFFFKKSEIM